MADKVRYTVKEKILVHLLSFSKFKDEVEVPAQTSQEGMAKAVGVRRSHIASALKDLKGAELVEEKKARIQGQERRKNAYFLSHLGQDEALRLKEAVLEKKITLKKEDGTHLEIKISELKDHIPQKLSVLEVLNRLSEDGTFHEKQEIEPGIGARELERKVVCPFCGQANKNFELNLVPLQNGTPGFMVPCFFCGKEFIAVEVFSEDGGVKNYIPTFLPLDAPQQQFFPQPFKAANSLFVSLGLFFMMASFSLGLIVALGYLSTGFYAFVPVGLVISLLLLFMGLKDVRHLDAISRRIVIIIGAVFIGFVSVFVGLLAGVEYEGEQAWILASVVLPAFAVFIFGKPLARSLRSELSMSLGVFLVLFGFFTIAFYDLFSWSSWFSPFWVISGALMVFTSYEIERLNREKILWAICMGGGAFVAVFCLVVIMSQGTDLWPYKAISALLWLLMGVFLVLLRFLDFESFEKSLSALRSSLVSGIGVLFILTGILLALNSRVMESVVEFFIGIPIIWLGLGNVKEFTPSQLSIIAFVIASEVFTVFSFVFF
ncbi:MAG: hypothetical protein JSV09_10920 [Thermoplasmata archaeon]|nr:MAG: hypothetical protein JSV09_10920 [Thermoplasmata archaeon]